MRSITVSSQELQDQLEELVDKLDSGDLDVIYITIDGEPELVMIPYEDYKALEESVDS